MEWKGIKVYGWQKKSHQQKTKDLDLLHNRILLLRKEEENTQKKINETQQKANSILQNKKRNEDFQKKKANNQKHDEEFLQLMQKKSCGLRKAQKDERVAIRMALLDLKREEANEIKRISKNNSQAITASYQRNVEEKKRKHDAVQSIVRNARMNVQTYWSERLRFFENQNEITKMDLNRNKQQKDMILTRLEQEELELIKRLQYSQDIHQNACSQLDRVIQMPASEYEKTYGPIFQSPAPKKTNVHKKQNSQGNKSWVIQPKKKQYRPIQQYSKKENASAVYSRPSQKQQQQSQTQPKIQESSQQQPSKSQNTVNNNSSQENLESKQESQSPAPQQEQEEQPQQDQEQQPQQNEQKQEDNTPAPQEQNQNEAENEEDQYKEED